MEKFREIAIVVRSNFMQCFEPTLCKFVCTYFVNGMSSPRADMSWPQGDFDFVESQDSNQCGCDKQRSRHSDIKVLKISNWVHAFGEASFTSLACCLELSISYIDMATTMIRGVKGPWDLGGSIHQLEGKLPFKEWGMSCTWASKLGFWGGHDENIIPMHMTMIGAWHRKRVRQGCPSHERAPRLIQFESPRWRQKIT